jgi:hypothetical protein
VPDTTGLSMPDLMSMCVDQPPLIHVVVLAPGREVRLTTYGHAILQRFVMGGPVRGETPVACEVICQLHTNGLLVDMSPTPEGIHACAILRTRGVSPHELEWMDMHCEGMASLHAVCEDIFVRNTDAWDEMERR